MPNLIKDYDVLGFDADHCIVKYNVHNLMLHINEVTAKDLHFKDGYPKEICDFEAKEIGMCVNAIVWDIERGNVLKLAEGKIIAKAYHGKKMLTQPQLESMYGTPPMFHALKYPEVCRQMNEPKDAYWLLLTYFECCKVSVICQGIDLIDRKVINKSYFEFSQDFTRSVMRQYAHYNAEEVFSIADFGEFFPEIIKNPLKYIQPQPHLRASLEHLIKQGKRLFLATNSHEEYGELIMKHTLGDDWKSLFDLSMANCRKPSFFTHTSPFYEVDKRILNYKGQSISTEMLLKPGVVYLEGNSTLVEAFFQQQFGRQNLRIAFFGDHYMSDVHYSSVCAAFEHVKWDAIAVIEELALYDKSLESSQNADHVLTHEYWGDNYFHDPKAGRNYFVSEVDKVARYALPFVHNISLML